VLRPYPVSFGVSFALRNHGMKALLAEHHPEHAFPVTYMLKDVGYALDLAKSAGLDLLREWRGSCSKPPRSWG
jgi:3-hydroxyisobutyrate dehydrogenase-like beta-hydroxyacid dehydrogenase